MFETTVLPVVERFARKAFRGNDDLVTLAIVLAWWVWRRRKADFPASVYARSGVRQAMQGRDLPGMQAKCSDCWRKLKRIDGAGMEGLADRRPGPDREAEKREQAERFLAGLSGRKLRMAEMFMDGSPVKEVANELNLSPGRITQMRQEVMDEFEEME
jgi:hypothetical protein